jgi:hypothetical protein
LNSRGKGTGKNHGACPNHKVCFFQKKKDPLISRPHISIIFLEQSKQLWICQEEPSLNPKCKGTIYKKTTQKKMSISKSQNVGTCSSPNINPLYFCNPYIPHFLPILSNLNG